MSYLSTFLSFFYNNKSVLLNDLPIFNKPGGYLDASAIKMNDGPLGGEASVNVKVLNLKLITASVLVSSALLTVGYIKLVSFLESPIIQCKIWLGLIDLNEHQQHAIDQGVPLKYAIQFTNLYQTQAFQTGKVSGDEALMFGNKYQIRALKTGKATVEEVLKFKCAYQVDALKTGKMSAVEALKFMDYHQLLAFQTGKMTVEEALNSVANPVKCGEDFSQEIGYQINDMEYCDPLHQQCQPDINLID